MRPAELARSLLHAPVTVPVDVQFWLLDTAVGRDDQSQLAKLATVPGLDPDVHRRATAALKVDGELAVLASGRASAERIATAANDRRATVRAAVAALCQQPADIYRRTLDRGAHRQVVRQLIGNENCPNDIAFDGLLALARSPSPAPSIGWLLDHVELRSLRTVLAYHPERHDELVDTLLQSDVPCSVVSRFADLPGLPVDRWERLRDLTIDDIAKHGLANDGIWQLAAVTNSRHATDERRRAVAASLQAHHRAAEEVSTGAVHLNRVFADGMPASYPSGTIPDWDGLADRAIERNMIACTRTRLADTLPELLEQYRAVRILPTDARRRRHGVDDLAPVEAFADEVLLRAILCHPDLTVSTLRSLSVDGQPPVTDLAARDALRVHRGNLPVVAELVVLFAVPEVPAVAADTTDPVAFLTLVVDAWAHHRRSGVTVLPDPVWAALRDHGCFGVARVDRLHPDTGLEDLLLYARGRVRDAAAWQLLTTLLTDGWSGTVDALIESANTLTVPASNRPPSTVPAPAIAP